MAKVKIDYSTSYEDYNTINGYVLATDCGDHLEITKTQMKNAINKLTIGNVLPCFHSEKPVEIAK